MFNRIYLLCSHSHLRDHAGYSTSGIRNRRTDPDKQFYRCSYHLCQSGYRICYSAGASLIKSVIDIHNTCGAFSVYLLYQLFHLLVTILRSSSVRKGNYRIMIMPEKSQSFSFFNLIFISASTAETDERQQVVLHELTHARQWHSADILLIQFIKIFQWFNPFIYLIEKALQETHEYLADEAVLEQDGQSDRYRLLLLTQVFGVQPGIFSFFNYSLIKNRLIMMTKEKSPIPQPFQIHGCVAPDFYIRTHIVLPVC